MKTKKKYTVCHLLYEEFPRDPRVRRYVNALNSEGIYCVIICSKKPYEKYFEEWNANRIYRIPISKKRASFFVTLIEYLAFMEISGTLLFYLGIKHRFKIIHIHTLPDFLVFAAFWNKIFGSKIILDLHEIFPELYMVRTGAVENSFKVKLLKLAERLSIKFANLVITIHDNAREIFVRRLADKNIEKKIHVVMNSVDPAEFNPPVIPVQAGPAERGAILSTEFTITYNGTVVKLLNLTMIVDALASLKNKIPAEDFGKIIFKIYGDGPALNDILLHAKKLNVENKVKYLGYIEPREMRKEVLKTSVLILPPLKNIYSDLFYTIKLIEAIYLKIPVIATRLNTYKRYYSEDSLFYFDSGDVNQLTSRIKEVFYNKELVKRKTESAFADYEKVGWNVMRGRYMEIIQDMLK
ncbi:MAG TPA: glycosyltransferase [Ignavibacteria bacterium]